MISISENPAKKDFSNWQLDATHVNQVINQIVYEKLINFLYEEWEKLLKQKGITDDVEIWQINSFKKDEYIRDLLPSVREGVQKILPRIEVTKDQQVVLKNEVKELSSFHELVPSEEHAMK